MSGVCEGAFIRGIARTAGLCVGGSTGGFGFQWAGVFRGFGKGVFGI